MMSRLCHGFAKVSFTRRGVLATSNIIRNASTSVSATAETSKHGHLTETAGRPLTNTPFIKNLFLGQFDKSMLVYPELTKEEYEEITAMVEPIEKFFNEGLDSKSIDVNAKIPDETLQQVKDLGLFGQQIPQQYGGLELNATKYARLAEVTALDGSIAVTLAAHQAIGLKGILIAGNEEQKQKYLPKLATGEHVAAFCLTEPTSGSDAASIQSRATLSEDGKHYMLNGNKIWISNGGIADVFTVFAKTPIKNHMGEYEDKVTAFIVERAFGGVSSGKPEDKLGIRGSNTCAVYFENTPVPLENILGEVGGGFKVAMNILNSGRFSMGSSGAGMLKKLITMTTEHANSRSQFGKKLKEFGIIQEKFAKMAVSTYAMESMAYLTAGTLDAYEKPDASVEAAIVKVFSSEGAWYAVNECLQILGGLGYMKDYPYERYLRDCRILLIFEGTNEILRLYIALTCLQHAGVQLRELVKKLSNPFNNMGLVLSRVSSSFRNKQDPPLRLGLGKDVHPNLALAAGNLEKRVLRLQTTTESVLSIYKNEILNEQMLIQRLANIAIDLYGMTACIARASRSLCIGLRNADHEMLLAVKFCFDASHRIDKNFSEIDMGPAGNGDVDNQKIADVIFKNQGWAAEHPLTRNW